jgi:soluble lytic murein transglycosylase-like protein
MLVALVLLITITETPIETSVTQALERVEQHDWKAAMTLLDRASIEDPAVFEANNLHYLRGRIAAEQKDWVRASEEFDRVGLKNTLRPLATWHSINAAMRLGEIQRASQLIDDLPQDFPAELKIKLAREAPPELELKLVSGMSTREARLRRARIVSDTPALWALIRENNSDDPALESARWLETVASTSREWKDLGATFLAQRQFKDAISAYERVVKEPEHTAEAQYQLARIQFLSEDYPGAIERYRALAAAFPGTDWEDNAESQIASSLWRLRDYAGAEKAYLGIIEKSKGKGTPEGAIRDLADIYRSRGENAKAIALIDRTLAGRVTATTRQVLQFTKAKILYSQAKYTTALQLIRQIKRSRIHSAPGGTSADEMAYFEALCLEKTGNPRTARTAWLKLAEEPNTYYGQRAAEKAGLLTALSPSATACSMDPEVVLAQAKTRLAQARRAVQTDTAAPPATDAVKELMFLQLWDEAALWLDRTRRPDPALAADLSYAAGRYHRAILHADRLGPPADALVYPPAFRASICSAAAKFAVDPLWLHAIIWQESKYDPWARSGAPARGLMQFIPDTAEAIAASAGIAELTLDRLYDPDISIQLGAYYWSTLMAEFKHPELALAAYNGGPVNVRRWRDKWPNSDGEFFVSDIGFTETKRYVQAVFGARAAYGRLH